jgi:hypothetical protein
MAGLYRLHLPLTVSDLEERLLYALTSSVCFRPHEGLGGATPAEVLLGVWPRHLDAVEAPRGRPDEETTEMPPTTDDLDTQNRFPILKSAA